MYSQSEIYDGQSGILGPAPDSDSSRYPGYYGFYANYGYLLPSNIHSPNAGSPIRKKASLRDRSKNNDKMSVAGASKQPEVSPATHHKSAAAPSPPTPGLDKTGPEEAPKTTIITCEPSQPTPKVPEPQNCISESLALADILMKNFRSLECETCGQHFGYESRRSKSSRPSTNPSGVVVVCSLKCAAILMEKSKDQTNENPNNVDDACAPVVQVKISTIQPPSIASAAAPPALPPTGKPKPIEPIAAASALNNRGGSISKHSTSDSVSSSVGNTNKEFIAKTSLVEKSKSSKQQQQRRRNLRPHPENENNKQRHPVPDFANLKHKNITIEKDPLPKTQSQIRPPSKPLPLRPPVEEPSFSRRPAAR